MGASGAGHTAKLLNNFLNGVSLAATAEVMVAAQKAGSTCTASSTCSTPRSGVNFATLNRFPKIVDGDYLEGGLTGDLMLKDLLLYLDFVARARCRQPQRGRAASRPSGWPPAGLRRRRSATASSTRIGDVAGGITPRTANGHNED